jgi:uncharacterized protein YjbI with pentapeptide repeats/beta-lactamase regulating signal transducer with metallopeptidase domain
MHALSSALEPIARITVATLFNSLWEAALLALAVSLILRALPNLNATTRYAGWCVALAGSLVLPLATAFPQVSVRYAHTTSQAQTSAQMPAPHGNTHRASTTIADVSTVPASSNAGAASNPEPAFKLPGRLQVNLPEYVALILFGAWGVAALVLLVRLGVNLWRLEHLKRDALPLPVDYRERLAQWSAAEKGEREVRLCVCDRIDVPVAVGLFDSMILIPQHLLETLSSDEIDQIMLHELGHLRRADDWTNGLQRVVQALFFFNPAILYIAQQLDLEREVACDDWVVHQTKSVRPYATCLTKMAEVTAWPHRALAAPGVFVTRRGLSVRVERLLRAGRNIRTSVSFGPAGAVVAALIVLFFALQNVAPTFAFTLGSETTATVAAPAHANTSPAHERVVYKDRTIVRTVVARATASPSPSPQGTDITIPARHIHVPARTIHVPAVNVDIPERHIHVPRVVTGWPYNYQYNFKNNYKYNYKYPNPLPSDFGAQITRSVNESVRASLEAARAGLQAARMTTRIGTASNKGFNCVGCDYSGQNLAGRSFRGQKLNGTDFSRANLQNADFSNAIIIGTDFSRASLRGANFSHAVLNGCDLTHADLSGANFDGVQMIGCDVDARSLSPTQARALIFACHNGCDFSGANLSGQNLRGLSLTGVDLSGADLRGADLSESNLNGVDFTGARLDGARFNGASLTGCDLSGVDLSKVDLSNARMAGDKLSREP